MTIPSAFAFAELYWGNHFYGAQTVQFETLVDAASIATDALQSNHFIVTLTGNRTLANPTNLRHGGIYNWWIVQGAGGNHTLAYGSKFKWPGGTVPTASTSAGDVDVIVGQYNSTLDIIACVMTKDFS